jgi:hypothetical protein
MRDLARATQDIPSTISIMYSHNCFELCSIGKLTFDFYFKQCDLTTMRGDEADNNNEGRVAGIAYNNRLGEGIRIASIEELGPGGSWSTCMIGCNKEPPQDVAHIQFKSRIAFKLVW